MDDSDKAAWLTRQQHRIDDQLKLLRARVARIDQHHTQSADLEPGDSADRSQPHDNDEVVGDLRTLATTELPALEHALVRIADGSYEHCIDCAEPIGHARLELVPTTTRCIVCQREVFAHGGA